MLAGKRHAPGWRRARHADAPSLAAEPGAPLGFYRHLTDTLRDIPFGNNDEGVFDNLVATSEMLLARSGDAEVVLPSEPPDSLGETRRVIAAALGEAGVPLGESLLFTVRMLEFLTSCDARRQGHHDHAGWWEFIDAENRSEGYRKFMGQGVTRSLVAMRAEVSSTRTIATIYFQMLAHLIDPVSDVDRLLDGPTDQVWLDPWVDNLRQRGVRIHREHECVQIACDGGRVTEVVVEDADGARTSVGADVYIAAVPVEVMVELLNDDLLAAAPSLRALHELQTAWMNGILFHLDRDVSLSHGHAIYLDAPWALTSISQAQFSRTSRSSTGSSTTASCTPTRTRPPTSSPC